MRGRWCAFLELEENWMVVAVVGGGEGCLEDDLVEE